MGYTCIRGKSGVKAQNSDIKIDQVIRTKRRTISLELRQDGVLIVRAPFFTSRSEIKRLVKSKETWIRKKQEMFNNRSLEAPAKKFMPGELFLFLGKPYPLEIVEEQTVPLTLNEKFSLAEKSQNEAKLVFMTWYREQASTIIIELVESRAQEIGFSYQLVRITNAGKRWGSCGVKGSLNFAWRLVMAPLEVIDYVVIHEMVHLKVKNHSKIYWREVEKIMPEYRHRKAWLKKNGHLLTLD